MGKKHASQYANFGWLRKNLKNQVVNEPFFRNRFKEKSNKKAK